MGENPHHRWQSLFWAAAGIAALFILLGFSPVGPNSFQNHIPPQGFGWSWDFDYDTAMAKPVSTINHPAAPGHDLLILIIDRPLSIDGLKITYRGLRPAGRFRLDVVDPALDLKYIYPHEISRSRARKGFSIFERRFVLTSIGPEALVLEPAAGK